MSLSRILLLAAVLSFVTFGVRADFASLETSTLVIDAADGPERFTVEMALTPEEQEQGLMFRNTLAPDHGMLFVFPEVQEATFWMKNTLIPLDMLFIAADGVVADIHERAEPRSEGTISSSVPVKAVLEINGGTAARLGIKVGTVVHQAVFGNAPS